jgi:hypothetical protein
MKTMEHHSPEQREGLWRKLSAGERAVLRGQPELELEARLTDALAHLPNVPVPSNFTARVLDAVALEDMRAARAARTRWSWSWRGWWPRVAATAAVLLVAAAVFYQHEASRSRSEMAKSLSLVASAKGVPSVDVLENLDVIQRMSQPAHADTELLAALQ